MKEKVGGVMHWEKVLAHFATLPPSFKMIQEIEKNTILPTVRTGFIDYVWFYIAVPCTFM